MKKEIPFDLSVLKCTMKESQSMKGESGSSQPKARSQGKRKSSSGLISYFPLGAAPGSQPSIKASLQSQKKWR